MKRRLIVLVLALVGSVVLLEGALRLRQWVKYGTSAGTFYRLQRDRVSGLDVPVPGHRVGPIRIDSLGFRGPEIEMPKPAGRVRVAFLGGSTTFCAEASSQERTWPHLVVEALRAAYPETQFDYVNGGCAGYSTAQSLLNLKYRVAPLQPDVIVIYHATNDLTQDSRALAVSQGLYDESATEETWLSRHWLTWYLMEKNLRYRARRRAREGQRCLEFEPEELSRPFRARLTQLIQESQVVASVVCVVTFSIRARPGQTPEEMSDSMASSLYYMPFMSIDGLMQGFAEYDRVIREVARATGAILVEDEDSIPGDAVHFNDSVHFLDPGLELQAARVSAGLLAAQAFQELVAHSK